MLYTHRLGIANNFIVHLHLAIVIQIYVAHYINCGYTLPLNAIDGLNLWDVKIFESVFILLKIFATLPVSTSAAEKSFPHYGE